MKSHYSDPTGSQVLERRMLCVLVDNEPGVLARIAGMFSGRGPARGRSQAHRMRIVRGLRLTMANTVMVKPSAAGSITA